MAFTLTTTALFLSQQTNIEQQIIVEIDGIPLIFGANPVSKLARYGDDGLVYGLAGLVYGGVVGEPNSRDYICLDGTTNNITQQLELDKGGAGSIQKFNVALIDPGGEITDAFTPGTYVSDILSREANVYISFMGAAHPEDSIRIFNGIVTGQEALPGKWVVTIDHPEFLKRQDIFQQVQTEITAAINNSVTTIPILDTTGFVLPQDAVRTFVQIDDELIEYTGVTPTLITGCTRASLTTVANSHDDEATVTTFYMLSGTPIDLALKVMLSDSGNTPYKTDVSVTQFRQIAPAQFIENALFFPDLRLADVTGMTVGDFITVTGATEAANNIVGREILDISLFPTGTVIIVDGAAVMNEVDSLAVASFTSRYNTLPAGAGCSMRPSQVDVVQHEALKTIFPSIPEYDLYIKDTTSGQDLITDQLYRPAGFYQVPRKGRASVNITIPPLVLEELKELTDENVLNPSKNKIARQLTKNFYNSVVYKFNRDSITEKFLSGMVILSARSTNRIPTGNKTLTIEADGFRNEITTRNYIKAQARRYSDRYQFAAESISVEVDYKTGFTIEVADIVLFGNPALQIPDITNGTRDFEPRLMEVINKSMNIKTGDIKLTLLDTGFGLDGRYGVISPNSFLDSGSSTTKLYLKASFQTVLDAQERRKWDNLVGEEIRVRSLDFSFSEVTRLVAFDSDSSTGLSIAPALSAPPPEGYIVDLPDYPDSIDPLERAKMKNLHPFWTPEIDVATGVSDIVFTVDLGDVDYFFVGSLIRVHTEDFSINSASDSASDDHEVTVVDTITGTITVDRSLGFTPAVGYKINLIGFKDQGLPYRLL